MKRNRLDWRVLPALVLLIAGMHALGRIGEQMQPQPSCSCSQDHDRDENHGYPTGKCPSETPP